MLLGSAVLLKPEPTGAVCTGAPPPQLSRGRVLPGGQTGCVGAGGQGGSQVWDLPTGMGEGQCPLREPESPSLGNFPPEDKAPNLPGSLTWLPEKDSLALMKVGGEE